ncbi:inactive tyrosine-protein kinase 7-like isoform X1 [Syngnathus acus]|uniref:inactive tyrosine-protein kinase 7-like isoform X1 n=1 Tax=Syngnathus acus TaxID=161584 RepID=UPI001885C959|nr:inactive tyrosine-protein kinase 7-like isoform X1 [Syngnathus acus]
MRIFSMRVALVLLLLSPWRPVKPEAGTSCTCVKDRACSCEVGQSVTLDSGESTDVVTWKKDGADIAEGKATYAGGAGKEKATINTLAKEDSGVYTAKWTSGGSITIKSFTVAVAPVICQANQVCAVTKGHSFKLPSGISSGTGKWAKESTGVDGKKFAETDQHDLISQADSLAAGMYVAIHDDDVTKMTAFLVQVHDPVTTVSVERVAAKQVSLSCIASGPFKGLKWKKGDTAITAGPDYKLGLNNAQLIIKDGSANPGKYTCVAVQFDGSEKESPALHLSSVTDGDVLLSNPGGNPSGGAGGSSQIGRFGCPVLQLCSAGAVRPAASALLDGLAPAAGPSGCCCPPRPSLARRRTERAPPWPAGRLAGTPAARSASAPPSQRLFPSR